MSTYRPSTIADPANDPHPAVIVLGLLLFAGLIVGMFFFGYRSSVDEGRGGTVSRAIYFQSEYALNTDVDCNSRLARSCSSDLVLEVTPAYSELKVKVTTRAGEQITETYYCTRPECEAMGEGDRIKRLGLLEQYAPRPDRYREGDVVFDQYMRRENITINTN